MPSNRPTQSTRKSRTDYNEFDSHFLKTLEIVTQRSYNSFQKKDLCKVYDILSQLEKTQVLREMAKVMKMTPAQIQKHYSNCYSRCKYPELSKDAQTLIQMFIHNYVTNNLGTRPLADISTFLKKYGILRFPGAVHAVASRAKREIKGNVYNGPVYNHAEFQMYFSKVQNEGNEIPSEPVQQVTPMPTLCSFSGSCDSDVVVPEPQEDQFNMYFDECSNAFDLFHQDFDQDWPDVY